MRKSDLAIDILTTSGPCLSFLGQAGFVFKSKKGTLIGLDMYMSNCLERIDGYVGFKRLLPYVLNPYDLEFDYVIATHPHYDHFDMDSIPLLLSNNKTKLIASLNCQQEVIRLKMDENRVSYFQPGEEILADDIKISFVPCNHGLSAPDAFGVVLEMDGYRIYSVGDSSLDIDINDQMAGADIMIAPINGKWGNLSEKDCIELSRRINPKLTIPCHYGMFAMHGGDPGVFKSGMDEAKMPYYLMAVGETIRINAVI